MSVTEVKIIEGELWIYFSNDTSINLGNIMGQDGEQGPQGEPGQDGNGWIVGSGEPKDYDGKDGDLYLDTTTAYIYQKIDGVWIFIDKLQPEEHVTVEFDLAGGEMSEPDIVNVEKGSYLQLPIPTRAGYTFLGWFVGEGVNAGQVTNTTAITQDITITAHWKANNYTVSFVETGDNSIDDITITYDQVYTLPTPTRKGYTFLGWYDGDNKVVSGTWNIARNVTLVARWQANTYTVTFETGMDQEIEPIEVAFGEQYTLPSPEREYYTFEGWLDGDSVVELTGNWSIARDVTLVASWEGVEYTVTYNNAEDCFNENPTTITISQLPYTLKDAGKNDHVFEGWYVDPDFTTRVTQIDQLGVTLYAKFTVATSGLRFEDNGNGVSVIGYMGVASDIIIPSYHNGFVTEIMQRAFKGYPITSIKIPASVMSITAGAFSGCQSLKTVVFAEGSQLKSISDSMFSDCKLLETVIFAGDNLLQSIGDRAFFNCINLVNVEIPSSVISIGSYAFSGCILLKTVVFDEGGVLQSIGYDAFSNCSDLTHIEIPSSVIAIGGGAFSGCSLLETVVFAYDSKLESIGERAFEYCAALTNIELPMEVISIGDSAFSGCSLLATIKFAEGSKLSSIGGRAFENCVTITNIKIPAGVFSIEAGAFKGCSSLETVVFDYGSMLQDINESLYYGCKNLKTIQLPERLVRIDRDAFAECSNLIMIKIPNSVESIGERAFSYCTSLKQVLFTKDSQLQSISNRAFSFCTSLLGIELPAGVFNVDENIFINCFNATIYCNADEKPMGWNELWNCDNLPVIWGSGKLTQSEKIKIVSDIITPNERCTNDFTLFVDGLFESTIEWEIMSGNGIQIVGNKAVVTRGEQDQVVKLKAIITTAGAVETVEFSVLVVKLGGQGSSLQLAATLSFDNKSKRTSFDPDAAKTQVWEQDGITFTNNQGASASKIADYANPIRCYAGSDIIVDYDGIVKLVFVCEDESRTFDAVSISNLGKITIDGPNVIITFEDGVDRVTITKLSQQTRILRLEVYTSM